MNLTQEFVIATLGEQSFEQLKSLKNIQFFLLTNIQPWMATITAVLNFVVLVLCIIMYLKTKRTNHKPAFVFIGALAIIDSVVGSIVMVWSLRFGSVLTDRAEMTYRRMNPEDCKFSYICGNYAQFTSVFILVALTIDRYVFIKKPLHYPLIMTPCRTWLLLLIPFLLSLLTAIAMYYSFELPLEDKFGQMCVYQHIFPGWMLISQFLVYSILLITVIVIYSVMLLKFRQTRKRLEALQHSPGEENYYKSNLTFHKTRVLIKKHYLSKDILSEVPGVSNGQIQTLGMKSLEDGQTFTDSIQFNSGRKRRHSSVVKMMGVLLSHLKAANYILILVVTLFVTLAPMFMLGFYEAVLHMIENETSDKESTLDLTTIYACLSKILQNKECEMKSGIGMGIGNDKNEVQAIIRKYYHDEQTDFIGFLLGNFLASFNSLFNPFLYAFWYLDFRTYLAMIPVWFKQRSQTKQDKIPELQYIQ